MAAFIVRVEMDGARPEKYDLLHEAMRAVNCLRTIPQGGRLYHLPPAEYLCTSVVSIDDVLRAVTAVATNVWSACQIVISGEGSVRTYGLKPVA